MTEVTAIEKKEALVDIRDSYYAEYRNAAFKDKVTPASSWALLGVFTVSLTAMVLTSIFPATPLIATLALGALAMGSMLKSFSIEKATNDKVEQKAQAAFQADIDNGSLIKRFEQDLRSKFDAVARLKGEVVAAEPAVQPQGIAPSTKV